jgi:hypothetical protein
MSLLSPAAQFDLDEQLFADELVKLADVFSVLMADRRLLGTGVFPRRKYATMEKKVECAINKFSCFIDTVMEDYLDEFEKKVETPSDEDFVVHENSEESDYEPSESESAEFTEQEEDDPEFVIVQD